MDAKEFSKKIFSESDTDYGILPPPTDAQKGLNVLIDHFLGEDWYAAVSMHQEQINSEAIYMILMNNPRRKPFKTRIKNIIIEVKKIWKS
jgi:hypothetical protein